MRKFAKNVLLVVLLVSSAVAQSPLLKDAEFVSKSLGRTMQYRILLPESYSKGETRYPVLYLLHGLYGNYMNWADKTSLQKYVVGINVIIVMPDANDSWYTNWDSDPKQKYEDYIIRDLLSEVDKRYRTIPSRESRWLAGLSMGGYAAVKFGLKYPQLFSVVASFSGPFDAATRLQDEVPGFAAQLIKVYGPANSHTRTENDVNALEKQAASSSLPYFYLTCGTSDRFLAANREFVADLPSRHIPFEYHESPGVHDWTFWDHSIQAFLRDFVPTLKH